jgi:hypothetical protein
MPTVRRKYIEDLDASAISDSFYNFCEIVINEQSEVGRGQKDCLSALRLAHGDVVVCQRMLNTLLRDAWRAISGDGTRLALVPAIESLLSRPFLSQGLLQSGVRYAHAKQRPRHRTINSIRSFLGASVGLMNPVPIFNVDLLVSLAENYKCMARSYHPPRTTVHDIVFDYEISRGRCVNFICDSSLLSATA